ADGRRGLGIGKRPAAALGEAELRRTERDRARADDDHLLPAPVRLGDLLDQARQPFPVRHAAAADQQRRADLEDDAGTSCGIGQIGEAFDRHGGALAERRANGKGLGRRAYGFDQTDLIPAVPAYIGSLPKAPPERPDQSSGDHSPPSSSSSAAPVFSVEVRAGRCSSTASSSASIPAPVAPEIGNTRPAPAASSSSANAAASSASARSILLSAISRGLSTRSAP